MANKPDKINETLKKILKQYETNSNKKWYQKIDINIISNITLALISVFITVFFSIKTFDMDKYNQNLVIGDDILIQHKEGLMYDVEFKIQQGGIKKVYIANVESDGIIYDIIVSELEDDTLIIDRKASIYNIKFDPENYLVEELGIKYIKEFALVILDTSNNWNVYYVVMRPEIDASKIYGYTLIDSKGEIVASGGKELADRELKCVLIDGALTNSKSIDNRLSELDEEYYLFEDPLTIDGKDGVSLTSNPKINLSDDIPDAEGVYRNIQAIYKDIQVSNL